MKCYDKQFKKEAVQLVLNQKRTVAVVARELGVHYTTLYAWLTGTEKMGKMPFPGSGNLKPNDKEIKLLKKKDH